MKINYKNTALGLIDDPENFNFYFPDPDITPQLSSTELREFGLSLTKSAHLLKDMCGNKIEYVRESFFEALIKGLPKLKPLLYSEAIEDSGIFMTGGDGTHMHTVYYTVCSVKHSDGVVTYNVLYIDFSSAPKREGVTLDVYTTFSVKKDSDIAERRSVVWNGYIDEGKDSDYWAAFIIAFCLFKKYCDIETKEVSPSNRRTKVAGHKYVNETDKRIKILDCTWFTNLVCSGSFGVSGHLRWQLCGPGRSEKKLVYVHDYEKKGYVRRAKVLNQNSNNEPSN